MRRGGVGYNPPRPPSPPSRPSVRLSPPYHRFPAGAFVQLSVKTVRKILRDAYKHLKELSNINRVPLDTPEDTVTVVRNLEGNGMNTVITLMGTIVAS